MRWVTTIIATCFSAQLCLGAVINVPGDQPTIQAGIDIALFSDTVLVEPGTYVENINFNGKGIVLVSAYGRDSTFIEPADPQTPIVTFDSNEDTTSVIDGFTVRNTSYARGIRCSLSSPIIRNCDIGPNSGSGILCEYSGAKIRFNRIHDNHGAILGGGLNITGTGESTLEVVNNEFWGNSANLGAGIYVDELTDSVLISANLVRNHHSGTLGVAGMFLYSTHFTVINNTVVDNAVGIEVRQHAGSHGDIRNNIIVSNTYKGLVPENASFDYNNIWNNGGENDPGHNGISVDPEFSDPASQDYSLMINSECIDRGDPNPIYNDPDGTRNDIGAIVFFQTQPVAVNINYGEDAVGNVILNYTPDVFWSYHDTASSNQVQFELEVGTDLDWDVAEMWSTGPITASDTSITYAGSPFTDHSEYHLRLRVHNGLDWGMWRQSNFFIHLTNIIHVPDDSPTIKQAVNGSLSSDTIIVAEGTYLGDNNRDIRLLGKSILLRSEGDPANTVIDCQGTHAFPHRAFIVMDYEDSTTVIEGFTIRGGYDRYSGGGLLISEASPTISHCVLEYNTAVGSGGGMRCVYAAPKVVDCTFRGNSSGYGGGVYVNSPRLICDENGELCDTTHPIFEGCSFLENSASKGGAGFFCQYGFVMPTLTGCLFSGNSAPHGGAFDVWASSSMSASHCTIVANTSEGYGIIRCTDGVTNIDNCIIAFNTGARAVYYSGAGVALLSCTDIFGNDSGDWIEPIADQLGTNGNFSADPRFCDPENGDYSINLYSPCAPDYSPCGELVGVYSIGCESVVYCGDADFSGEVDIDDAVYLIAYIFAGGAEPLPYESGDADCSGGVDIDDVVWLIAYIFSGGNAPCDIDGDGEPDC